MRRFLLLTPFAVAALIAGCGSSSSSSSTTASSPPAASTTASTTASASTSKSVMISTASVAGLGTVLVDSTGHTLYTYAPDKKSKVTCTAGCAAFWPPAKLASGEKPVAGAGVKASLLGSDPDPSGGQVATYAGWPLYTFLADKTAGAANGQALDSSGGLWYVISPSGTVITKKAGSSSSAPATTSTSSSGGSGYGY
jgi:predicted lipoprotein with Yx(FWY)xxD motif